MNVGIQNSDLAAPASRVDAGSSAITPTQRRYFPVLDGVRAVAILMVLVLHFGGPGISTYIKYSHPIQMYQRTLSLGWLGVDLFFVLSGFLITGILLEARGSRHYLRNFYSRRVLRIFPLYYLTLIVCLLVLPRISKSAAAEFHDAIHLQGWLWLYGANLLIAARDSFCFGHLSHLWSLAVEEHFYFVWPFLILWFDRKTMMRICAGIIVVTPFLRLAVRVMHYKGITQIGAVHLGSMLTNTATPFRADALALGALVALCVMGDGGRITQQLKSIALWTAGVTGVALAGIFVVEKGLWWYEPVMNVAGYTLVDLLFASAIILALAFEKSAATAPLRWRPMRLIGKYSYAMYMLHEPLQPLMLAMLPTAAVVSVVHRPLVSIWIQTAIFIAVTFGVGFTSYHVIEQPFLRLKRFFETEKPARKPVDESQISRRVDQIMDKVIAVQTAKDLPTGPTRLSGSATPE
jgi:peptidoglycan/LPS O-acetylase OafA/YrhL